MSHALPRVAGRVRRGEWAALAGAGVLLSLTALDADVAALRESGIMAPAWHTAVGAVLRTSLWLLAAPLIFAVLDRLPVRGAVAARNLALRIVCALVANAAHAIVAGGFVAVLGPTFGRPHVVEVGWLPRWGEMLGGSFDGVLAVFLAHVIVQRVHRGRERDATAAELEASLTRARLHALSKELEPHFLFNTLNGITALVRDEPERAEAMLVKLGDMLRRTLDGASAGEISLGEELERLAPYVELQQMRFGQRLTVRYEIEPDAEGLLVPGMVLQPLVENALSHGIEPVRGPGTVTVAARVRSDRLRITVHDTGDGFAAGAGYRESTGIGNTRARLSALYPGNHTLELGELSGSRGALVTIDIPARRS